VPGRAAEVFTTFLRLGLIAFGGPVAHLGYFRREIVEKRRWIGEAQFAQLMGLCQLLPGPASSQLGFTLGLLRAGWPGALAAFAGFTLPAALLMYAFARVLPGLAPAAAGVLVHGLKLVAVAVVADGTVRMFRQLCPDATRAVIAVASAGAVLAFGGGWVQLAVVAAGALAGLALCRSVPAAAFELPPLPHGHRTGVALFALYLALLVALPFAAHALDGRMAVAAAFYRAGALVFGGGHVVLPLLQETVVDPGWISRDAFLAGYGAAQAVPGPMFSLAAYLGARLAGELGGAAGALTALLSIMLPGLLLVAAVLPLWGTLVAKPGAVRAIAGVNAAVVGLLAAALYDPVWVGAVLSPPDAFVALAGYALLAVRRASSLWVVAWCLGATAVRAWLGG
jgi:chromate transporter